MGKSGGTTSLTGGSTYVFTGSEVSHIQTLPHCCRVVSVRACLQLITDCPQVVQDELDLISALSQLEDFSVRILPLQGMPGHFSDVRMPSPAHLYHATCRPPPVPPICHSLMQLNI